MHQPTHSMSRRNIGIVRLLAAVLDSGNALKRDTEEHKRVLNRFRVVAPENWPEDQEIPDAKTQITNPVDGFTLAYRGQEIAPDKALAIHNDAVDFAATALVKLREDPVMIKGQLHVMGEDDEGNILHHTHKSLRNELARKLKARKIDPKRAVEEYRRNSR